MGLPLLRQHARIQSVGPLASADTGKSVAPAGKVPRSGESKVPLWTFGASIYESRETEAEGRTQLALRHDASIPVACVTHLCRLTVGLLRPGGLFGSCKNNCAADYPYRRLKPQLPLRQSNTYLA
uniref:Uncharacterized protein n=1 Tax=Trichuris muris TaxID=70415 RepID=A0A5S6QBR8_TRIMR